MYLQNPSLFYISWQSKNLILSCWKKSFEFPGGILTRVFCKMVNLWDKIRPQLEGTSHLPYKDLKHQKLVTLKTRYTIALVQQSTMYKVADAYLDSMHLVVNPIH